MNITTAIENGIRTPGPEEIKQLAKALEISPAYLMCLTDQAKEISIEHCFISLLNPIQACDPKNYIQTMKHQWYPDEATLSNIISYDQDEQLIC